jgi:hypothetical protein
MRAEDQSSGAITRYDLTRLEKQQKGLRVEQTGL